MKLHSGSGKAILANIPAREWRGLTPEWAGGRLRVPLKCSTCGGEDHWTATRIINPNTAIPKIIRMGWQVGGKLLCPLCVVAHRHGSPSRPKLQIVENIMTNNVAKLETPKLLDEQKKNKRLVILALEDYYDESTNRYREGRSDKTTADELNLSAGFIATVREEFYGKLAEPEAIGQFREDLKGMQTGLDNLKAKFETMCNRNGWKV